MKHEYSTIFIFFLLFIAGSVLIVVGLSSSDIDTICNVNDSILRRTNGTWQCGSETDPTVGALSFISNFTSASLRVLTVNKTIYTDDDVVTFPFTNATGTYYNSTIYQIFNGTCFIDRVKDSYRIQCV